MPIDYKKTEKDLYQPRTTPSIINVPEMTFITVDGKGDPNTSAEYTAAVELLYGLSYTIKMGNKSILEYVVPPLEGFWSVDDDFRGGGAVINDKSKFKWTMVLRQPDFVTADIFEAAKAALEKKKPSIDTSKAKPITITEGLCVQIMHIGSYDDEGVWELAGVFDLNGSGKYIKIGLEPGSTGTLRTYAIKFVQTTLTNVIISATDPGCVRSGEPDVLWRTSTTLKGPSGTEELHYLTSNMEDYITYPASGLDGGTYILSVYVINYGTVVPDAKYTVRHSGKTSVAHLEYNKTQAYNSASGGVWVKIGKYEFEGGSAAEYVQAAMGEDSANSGAQLRVSSIMFERVPGEIREPNVIRVGEENTDSNGVWYVSNTQTVDDSKSPAFYQKMTGRSYSFKPGNLDPGLYEVYYYRVKDTANDNKVRAYISHGGKTDVRTADFAMGGKGWVSLGTYGFLGSADEFVKFERLQSPDSEKLTYAAAVKFVPVSSVSMNAEREIYATATSAEIFSYAFTLENSGLLGPDGITKSSNIKGPGTAGRYISFAPSRLEAGIYDVYYYKLINPAPTNNPPVEDKNVLIQTTHNGKTDQVYIDGSEGSSEYVFVGSYDFAGSGNSEDIKVIKVTDDETSVTRAVSIKLVGPKIAPDKVDNVPGKDVTLQYPRALSVTGVSVGASPISGFNASDGKLMIDGANFPSAGDYEITISAAGQADMTVTQTIGDVSGEIISGITEAELTGTWTDETTLTGYGGGLTSKYSSDAEAKTVWTLDISVSGRYGVYFYNATDASNADRALLTIKSGKTVTKKLVDIKGIDPGWVNLGGYSLKAGDSITLSQAGGGIIRADAIKLVYRPQTDLLVSNMVIGNYAEPLVDLVAATGRLSVETEIYNNSDEAVDAPKVYAAVYDSDGRLGGITVINPLEASISPGGSTWYFGGLDDVSFENGAYVSLFIWDDEMVPIGSRYTNIYTTSE